MTGQKVNTRIELEFANVTIPVEKNADGLEVVPIKPITEIFGLDWQRQYDRLKEPYLTRRLGVCIGHMPYAGQGREMVCIRLDRVTAYLNQINPMKVRSAGNEIGADFLEAKQCEWDDVIHEYESRKHGMLKTADVASRNRAINVRLYLQVLREKRVTDDERDRKALSTIAEELAADAGIPYQSDLLDTPQ